MPMLPTRAVQPAEHVWLRVCDPAWSDPLDTSHAARAGGRWNSPHSWAALYLNRDLYTARAQIARLLQGSPVEPEDLADDAFSLVAVMVPEGLIALDVVTAEGVAQLALPASYPLNSNGQLVAHARCQAIAVIAHSAQLDGVECRSAATRDGSGREFAWWPHNGARALQVGPGRRYGTWRDAELEDTKRLFALP